MRKAFLALFFLMAGGPSCWAAEISGATRGEFVAAVEAWLDGDDAGSIPVLADIAGRGNRAAQLFLARLERRGTGVSPWRAGLTRDEAQTIYRPPQENLRALFRPSWLKVAADDGDELAMALLDARNPIPDPDVIGRLNALGEPQAADHPTRIVALHGSEAQRQALLDGTDLQEELRPFLLYLQGEAEPRGDGVAVLRHIAGPGTAVDPMDEETAEAAGLLALGWSFGQIAPGSTWWPVVTGWLMSAPAMQPIAELCEEECRADAPACALVLFSLTGGYYEAIRLDSPLESVVPQEVFLASPRARLEALRRAAHARSETFEPLAAPEDIAPISACAADLVTRERGAP